MPPPSNSPQSALQLLCECIYQPTDARRDALLSADLSSLPRVRDAFDQLEVPVTPSALSEACWKIIHEAVVALEPRFPVLPDSITPLEVVRWHVLERQPWPSIEAMLKEENRPFSRGTLIRRQHEFLPYLENWASAREGNPVPSHPSAPAARPLPRKNRLPAIAILVSVLAVIAIGWMTQRPQLGPAGSTSSTSSSLPMTPLGRQIKHYVIGHPLPAPWSGLSTPPFESSEVNRVIPIVLEHDGLKVLFSYGKTADPAAWYCLWDPATSEVIWEQSFIPPSDERLTHAGVGDEVRYETYRTTRLFHNGPEGDLGNYVAAVLIQTYSPTFVIYLNLDTGHVDGHYVMPGQAMSGIVVDLGLDGRRELILGAQDNSLHRPAVVVLRPEPGVRAASTVSWNKSGREGALCRILLPACDEAARALDCVQLAVQDLEEGFFDPGSRTLSVPVFATSYPVYHARLDATLHPAAVNPIVIWDIDRTTQRSTGLKLPPIEEWEDEFLFLEGTEPAPAYPMAGNRLALHGARRSVSGADSVSGPDSGKPASP